jgi:hypothetical protein
MPEAVRAFHAGSPDQTTHLHILENDFPFWIIHIEHPNGILATFNVMVKIKSPSIWLRCFLRQKQSASPTLILPKGHSERSWVTDGVTLTRPLRSRGRSNRIVPSPWGYERSSNSPIRCASFFVDHQCAQVTGAGLKSVRALYKPHLSDHVFLRPLATSRINRKISQPTSSMVASPAAIRPASTSIRSSQRSARSFRVATLITGAEAFADQGSLAAKPRNFDRSA